MSVASDITRRAKSNLAFALSILAPDRRQDMVVFYAFCRTLDDLADDSAVSVEQREKRLEAWRQGLVQGFENPEALQRDVIALRTRREIPNHLLLAILDGCRSDLQPQRFETWEELSGYVWKVAGAVGLVSIRLFGCTEAASERYAVVLAQALQLTNILRDVQEDLANGQRIYLPLEDLARFGYRESDLIGNVEDSRFQALMAYQAERAESLFREAAACLPVADRIPLRPARMMAEIYQNLLARMQKDGFRVFKKRYRVSKIRKLTIFSKYLIARKV